MSEHTKENIYQLFKTVATPLKFFTIAIVLLGLMIVGLAVKSSLPPEITKSIILVLFVVFVLLIIIVTILVIFFPKKLTFDKEAHLTVLRERLSDSELNYQYFIGTVENIEGGSSPKEIKE